MLQPIRFGLNSGRSGSQPLTLICNYPNAKIYTLSVDLSGLRILDVEAGLDWAAKLTPNASANSLWLKFRQERISFIISELFMEASSIYNITFDYLNYKDYQRKEIATAICNELERAVDVDRITTCASITAKPFFLIFSDKHAFS